MQPEALSRDPIRTLRAVRLALNLDFALTPATKTAVLAAAPLLITCSVERQRDELVKLLDGEAPDRALALLAELGLLPIYCRPWPPWRRWRSRRPIMKRRWPIPSQCCAGWWRWKRPFSRLNYLPCQM
ncbi:MAG: hypothetical protein M5U34_24575 [Chloroflexi bacterium]|nr:hypothetical protein [Chloroflexota bacterium]